MRSWPRPSVMDRVVAVPTPALLAACAVLLAPAVWWAATGVQEEDNFVATEEVLGAASANKAVDAATTATIQVPPTALAASLYDELFPEPPAPEPVIAEQPPPALDVALVAIFTDQDVYRAFVRVTATHEYLCLAAGDRTPAGAVTRRIENNAVVFQVGQREARLEIEP